MLDGNRRHILESYGSGPGMSTCHPAERLPAIGIADGRGADHRWGTLIHCQRESSDDAERATTFPSSLAL